MSAKLHYDTRAERHGRTTHSRGMMVGCIGGLVGTIVMDLFGAGLFLIMSGPASLSFAIIGDAAAGGFSLLGFTLAGGAPLGALLHYLIGLALGCLFGAAVSRVAALRVDSLKKAVGMGMLYVEVMSLPMLASAALILRMTAAETAQWFGISFVMHLVYGLVLGLVVRQGLRAAPSAG